TQTARCSLAGTAEFTVSLMARRSCTPSLEEWARSEPEDCFVTATVACGSEPTTRDCYTYTKEEPMYLDRPRASQAKPASYFLRIAKAVSGWRQGTGSIAFATLLSPRFL